MFGIDGAGHAPSLYTKYYRAWWYTYMCTFYTCCLDNKIVSIGVCSFVSPFPTSHFVCSCHYRCLWLYFSHVILTHLVHRVSLDMAHLLSSICHATDTTLCYKTRPCGTAGITCTTIGVPSQCMELLTHHTPLHTSSPEPYTWWQTQLWSTNRTEPLHSVEIFQSCWKKVATTVRLWFYSLSRLKGSECFDKHQRMFPHTNYQNEGTSIPCSHNTKCNKRGIWGTSVPQPAQWPYHSHYSENLISYIILLSLLRNVQRRVPGGLAGHSHW